MNPQTNILRRGFKNYSTVTVCPTKTLVHCLNVSKLPLARSHLKQQSLRGCVNQARGKMRAAFSGKMKLNEFYACSPFSSHEGIPAKIVSISEVVELAAGSSAVNRSKHCFNV